MLIRGWGENALKKKDWTSPEMRNRGDGRKPLVTKIGDAS